MSRSSEAHSYTAADAVDDVIGALWSVDAVFTFFGSDIEIIESIESAAKRGLTQCQVWWVAEFHHDAVQLAEILKDQGFVVDMYENVMGVSWFPQVLKPSYMHVKDV